MDQMQFEQTVLYVYEKAFELQRMYAIAGDLVTSLVNAQKLRKKKVWAALEAGHQASIELGTENPADFAATWIYTTIMHLGENSNGRPEHTLDADRCYALFSALMDGSGLPVRFTGSYPPGSLSQI